MSNTNHEVNQSQPGIPYINPSLPETNFDEIYTVLIASQSMAIDNYRMHIAAANQEREDRKKMVEFSPAKGQITLVEQEHLTRAIEARKIMEDISSALRSVAISEEKFTYASVIAASGNIEDAKQQFDYSSVAMQAAAKRVEIVGAYSEKNPLMAKAVYAFKNGILPKKSSENDAHLNTENAYEFGFNFGSQLKVFSLSMNAFASRIKEFPSKISELVKEKKETVSEAVSSGFRSFYSRTSKIFSNKKDNILKAVYSANDAVTQKQAAIEDSIWSVLEKCSAYTEVVDDMILKSVDNVKVKATESKNLVHREVSGLSNVVSGVSADVIEAASPALKTVTNKLSNFGSTIMTGIEQARNRVSELYDEGASKATDQQQRKNKIAP